MFGGRMQFAPTWGYPANFAGVRRRPPLHGYLAKLRCPRRGRPYMRYQAKLPCPGRGRPYTGTRKTWQASLMPPIRSGHKKSRTCFTADPAYLNKNEISSGKKRGFFFVYRLCLVIRERLRTEALDEAADLGDLGGAVADVDARRGRERVVRVGALEEQVAEDAMRGGLH